MNGKNKKADPGLRKVIFSRRTAMVTMPPKVRDKMMLVKAHRRGHKVRVVFVPDKGYSGGEYPPKGHIEVRITATERD